MKRVIHVWLSAVRAFTLRALIIAIACYMLVLLLVEWCIAVRTHGLLWP